MEPSLIVVSPPLKNRLVIREDKEETRKSLKVNQGKVALKPVRLPLPKGVGVIRKLESRIKSKYLSSQESLIRKKELQKIFDDGLELLPIIETIMRMSSSCLKS